MNAKSATQYQNGIIDIFKIHKAYDLNLTNLKRKGEVSSEMDSEIGRKVIKLSGTLSASNFIEIPNTEFTKSLNYTGKFYYIIVKTFKDRQFMFQLCFSFNNTLIRLNFKYPKKEPKFTRTNSINLDVPVEAADGWSIIAVDPIDVINKYIRGEVAKIGALSHETLVLRSLTFSASQSVKGCYVSNVFYSLRNLPKEMSSKHVEKADIVKMFSFMNFTAEVDRLSEGDEEEDDEENNGNKDSKKGFYKRQNLKDIENDFKRFGINEHEDDDDEISQHDRKKRDGRRKELGGAVKNNRRSISNDYDLKELNTEILKKNVNFGFF